MKKKFKKELFTLALCLLLEGVFFIGPAFTQDNNPHKEGTSVSKAELNQNVEDEQGKTKEFEFKKVLDEALNAYEETVKAIEHLDKGEKDLAIQALERSVGKMDILIGRYPEIAYLPIDIDVQTLDVVSDLATIRQQRDEIEFLVKKGYLQAARKMLAYMASEIRVISTNLPMKTYPTAIRGVARLIEEDKLEEAKNSLATTLSTVIRFERSIPIPVLNSQALIAEATKIINKEGAEELSKDKKDEALALLKRAHEELDIAEELGYGKRNWEFAEIHNAIKEIENKVKINEKSVGLLDSLKERLEKFKNRISK